MTEINLRVLENEGRKQEIYTDPLNGKISKLVCPDETEMVYDWNDEGILVAYSQIKPVMWQRRIARTIINQRYLTIISLFKDESGQWIQADNTIRVLADSFGNEPLIFEPKEMDEKNILALTTMELPTEHFPWIGLDPTPDTPFYSVRYFKDQNGIYNFSKTDVRLGKRNLPQVLMPINDPVLKIFPQTISLP